MSRAVFDRDSAEDNKRVACLLNGLGAKAYIVLENLVVP